MDGPYVRKASMQTRVKPRSLAIGLSLLLGMRLWAQPEPESVRLAIVVEAPSAAALGELLTVELTKRETLALLERAEIERVFEEQRLSAGTRDYVRLGRLLRADGLVLIEPAMDGSREVLGVRLVAVRAGIVLDAVRSPWPVGDALGWASGLVSRFDPLLPKLIVQSGNALPISVVNVRSSLQTREQLTAAQEELSRLAVQLGEIAGALSRAESGPNRRPIQ